MLGNWRVLTFAVAIVVITGSRISLADDQKESLFDTPADKATELRVQAEMLAKAGDFITADEMFVRSIKVAYSDSNHRARDWSLLLIATAQARAGSIYAGLETANAIKTEKYQHWALRDIAPLQAASGDVDGALETAGSISIEKVRAEALGSIAISQARSGSVNTAGVIADRITEPATKARAYAVITRAMASTSR